MAHEDARRPAADARWEDEPRRASRDLATAPGAGTLSRAEATRDSTVRRWGVVTPAATVIGRPEEPGDDLSESVRRLHDEQHAATAGYSTRAHYVDRLRTTQALCNAVGLTPWERDRVLGIMGEIELRPYGQRAGIETVALVVIRHVVDIERRRQLGLDNLDPAAISEDRLETLYEEYRERDIVDEPAFERLAEARDLDRTSLNQLRRTLREQLADEPELVFGRNPHRDPHLPSIGITTRADDHEATDP
ncbi:MAG: DNA-directed RNA polymerase subunit epsilon [Halobacteriaceae archaeon]